MKNKTIFFVICFFFLFSGCARIITTKPEIGNRISLSITFRDKINTFQNTYYIVFSDKPINVMSKKSYFFAPGEVYDKEKLDVSSEASYYYENFFFTWRDFVTLKNRVFYITKGPFVAASQHSTYLPEFLSYMPVSISNGDEEKKIKLNFDLTKFTYPLPKDIYFNILSVDSNGKLQDFLLATDNKISVNFGSKVYNISEPPDISIDGALDIISWEIEIQ